METLESAASGLGVPSGQLVASERVHTDPVDEAVLVETTWQSIEDRNEEAGADPEPSDPGPSVPRT